MIKSDRGGLILDYKVIYSARRTLAIAIKDGEVIVRAPYKYPKYKIAKAVEERRQWINKHLPASRRKTDALSTLSEKEAESLKVEALAYFKDKCSYYAAIMGVSYSSITITKRKAYGSCNTKRELYFSYKLMMFPEEAREYVVVHELAHLFEMNHSKRFYEVVARYMPDYKKRNDLLKSGAILSKYLPSRDDK